MLKLKTTALILALLLCIPITAASASQIVIEDADTIWNVTSHYPPKLINTTKKVTSRVTIESANTNHCEALIYPREFMVDTIPPMITDISVISLDSKPQDYTDFHKPFLKKKSFTKRTYLFFF